MEWCDGHTFMREIVFRVQPGHGSLQARAEHLPLTIQAASLEELQHEARDALIRQFGPAHATYRVRIRRDQPAPRPLHSAPRPPDAH